MDEVEKMDAMRDMIDTDGWALVEKFITDRAKEARERLMSCPIEDVVKLRAKVDALNSVLNHIQQTIDEGRIALLRK